MSEQLHLNEHRAEQADQPNAVCAVVVSFNPQPEKLLALLAALKRQVFMTVVIDNGSEPQLLDYLQANSPDDRVTWVALKRNAGVAVAQNMGIAHAQISGASHVILFDHDSSPPEGMVHDLVDTMSNLIAAGHAVAAVGPRFTDPRRLGAPMPFFEVYGFRLVRKACTSDTVATSTDVLISSGCLISLDALAKIGLMKDELFVDYVDIEWSLRARAKGYLLFGACQVVMPHELGATPVRILGKHFPMHSPLRHYYHFRNAVWLLRQPWVTWSWRWVDAWKLIFKLIFYSFFVPDRLTQARLMWQGIFHGLTDRLGPRLEDH